MPSLARVLRRLSVDLCYPFDEFKEAFLAMPRVKTGCTSSHQIRLCLRVYIYERVLMDAMTGTLSNYVLDQNENPVINHLIFLSESFWTGCSTQDSHSILIAKLINNKHKFVQKHSEID